MVPRLRCPVDLLELADDGGAALSCSGGHRYLKDGAIVDLQPGAEAPGFGRLRAATYDLTFDLVNTRLLFGATPRHLAALHRQAAAAAAGGVLLDVACGTGRWAIPELSRAAGTMYVGVDPAMPMLRLAQDRARRAGVDALLLHSDAERLPLADASVAAAVLSLGLQYVPDHGAALAELRRVLTPGGLLCCVAPALGLRPRYDQRHHRRVRKDHPIDRERWPALLCAAGFDGAEIETVGALVFTQARVAA